MTEVESSGNFARLRAFHRDPLGFFQNLERRYGSAVSFRMGPWRFFLLTDPSRVGQVLAHHRPFFHKGPGLDPKNPLIGRGLLTSEDENWVTQRRHLAPVFSGANVRHMTPTLHAIIHRELDRWTIDEPFDLEERLLHLSLTLVVRTLFSDDTADQKDIEAAGQAVKWLMAHFYHRSRSVWRFPYHVPGFNRRYHLKERILHRFINNLKPRPRPFETVWPHLSDDSGKRLEEAATLVIAGYETTGHAMAWALHQLAQYPEVEEAVRTEGEDENNRSWTEAVLKESLRLFPPVWLLSRRAVQRGSFENLEIPDESLVLICPWLMHRNPEFFPNPDTFDPERWLNPPTLPPYAFIPFGAGPRRCIGEHLALKEAGLVVSEILKRFQIEPRDAHPAVFPGLTLASQDGLWVTVRPRSQ